MWDDVECPRTPDLVADWEAGEDLSGWAEHRAVCAACRGGLAEAEGLSAVLRSADPAKGVTSSPGMREALLARCHASLAPPAPVPSRPRRLVFWWSAGVAAVALLLFAAPRAARKEAAAPAPGPVAFPEPARTSVPALGALGAGGASAVPEEPAELRPRPAATHRRRARVVPGRRRRARPVRRNLRPAPPPRLAASPPSKRDLEPPRVIIEAEGGEPPAITQVITISAVGENAVVSQRITREEQP